MKKKILFGSILAVFIMVMLPSASAAESETAIERNKLRMYIEELQEEIGSNPVEPTIVLRLLLWLRNLVLIVIFGIILLIAGGSSNNTTAFF